MNAPSARRCWLAPRATQPARTTPIATPRWTLGAWIYPHLGMIRCNNTVACGTTDQVRLIGSLCELLTLSGRGDCRLVVRTETMRVVAVIEHVSAGISRVEWW